MKKTIYAIVSVFITLVFLSAMIDEASAIAAWGRKYGVSCGACHRGQWDLNKDGQEFMRRGHRYEQEKAGPNLNDYMSFSTKLRGKYDETAKPRSNFEHHAFALYAGGALTERFATFTEIYLHENSSKTVNQTLPISDNGARVKLAESFLQWTSGDGPQYHAVRAGQIMPSLIHRFGGGARSSYSRPIVLTTTDTISTNYNNQNSSYAFFRRDYGLEYSRAQDKLFVALGLVNGAGGSAGTNVTDTDNHRDWYGTVDYTFDDNGSKVGYYYYDGDWTGTGGSRAFKRHAAMADYILDDFKLTGFWAWGTKKMNSDGDKQKLKAYYGQLDMSVEKYLKMTDPLSIYVRHEFFDYNKSDKGDLIRQNVGGVQWEMFENGHIVMEYVAKRAAGAAHAHQNSGVVEIQYMW